MTGSMLVYGVLLLVLVVMFFGSTLARRINLRRIPAYTAMPLTVGEAVESDMAIHVSYGSSAVRDASTISAIAVSEVLYHLVERAAVADKPALVTMSDPVTLALGQDTLRRAYNARDALRKYRPTLARWYPQGPNSLAFAAGVGAAMLDESISTNVLAGRFGSELMLMAENAIRYDRFLIAHSDNIFGQSIAYVVSDSPLIGEELYAGGAYLGRGSLQIGGVVTQDVLRYIIITIIIGMAILFIFSPSLEQSVR
jgi:hypothetical protein